MNRDDEAQVRQDYCVVITTCSSDEEADGLCAGLLDKELAACIQILDIKSQYVWKGERQIDPEKLLLVKTRRSLYGQVEEVLRSIHPYDTPEIICLPVVAGSTSYLNWIDEVTIKT